MKTILRLLALVLFLTGIDAHAHPGSGIHLDREGNVYFVDTGSGVWKIDLEGKLTRLSAPAYHWMAIDVDHRLANVRLPRFPQGGATVTAEEGGSGIIVSSDFPITVGPDGALYYPWTDGAGRLQVFRLGPSGETTAYFTFPQGSDGRPIRWVNDIHASADGSIYYTEDKSIRRISPEGKLSTITESLTLSPCDSIPGVGPELAPNLRGMTVDNDGNIFVAASGCAAVLKITADGKVTTILQASPPWSPTAVAVAGDRVYVLEYLHTATDDRREWIPRVRKVFADGRIVILARIDREE